MRTLILFFLFAQTAFATPKPLGLPWGVKVERHFQALDGYRYELGDVSWGRMYFEGKIQAGIESELLVLFTTDGKIERAYLTLGPIGISEMNCISRYREVITALSLKYGPSIGAVVTRDSIIEDLIFVSECYAIAVGVAVTRTMWKVGDFEITASIFSDFRDILIEIEYVFVPIRKVNRSELLKLL